MTLFISGLLTAGYLVAGLFFLKFYRKSEDRLFLMFAISLWMLAIQRALLGIVDPESSTGLMLYVLRLCAFLLIIAAVVDKNRRAV